MIVNWQIFQYGGIQSLIAKFASTQWRNMQRANDYAPLPREDKMTDSTHDRLDLLRHIKRTTLSRMAHRGTRCSSIEFSYTPLYVGYQDSATLNHVVNGKEHDAAIPYLLHSPAPTFSRSSHTAKNPPVPGVVMRCHRVQCDVKTTWTAEWNRKRG